MKYKRILIGLMIMSMTFLLTSCMSKPTVKWGYINKEGDMIIPIQFDAAAPFREGLAAVRMGDSKNGKWGYINSKGEFEIEPKFDGTHFFSEGLAAIRVGDEATGKWGFIDKEG
ncbi:MAG: WG repeat-containing protein, partial [Epulopiscium sp.]|nr:WG repeat-containing protein [Candidatus Epulonipiscium sp.]